MTWIRKLQTYCSGQVSSTSVVAHSFWSVSSWSWEWECFSCHLIGFPLQQKLFWDLTLGDPSGPSHGKWTRKETVKEPELSPFPLELKIIFRICTNRTNLRVSACELVIGRRWRRGWFDGGDVIVFISSGEGKGGKRIKDHPVHRTESMSLLYPVYLHLTKLSFLLQLFLPVSTTMITKEIPKENLDRNEIFWMLSLNFSAIQLRVEKRGESYQQQKKFHLFIRLSGQPAEIGKDVLWYQ